MIIFPLDHGVSFGPIPGIKQIDFAVKLGVRGGVDALVLFKGMLRLLTEIAEPLPGVFAHLSASTSLGPSPNRKVLIGSVEEALQQGADGVSIHVNLGHSSEHNMLHDLGTVSEACNRWQLPLLVMIYVRKEGDDLPASDMAIAHAARVAAELGADIVKIPAPEDFSVLSEITSSLPVPIVVAGGSKIAMPSKFLEKVEKSLQAGVRGVAIGRNLFQDERPDSLLRAIKRIVHEGVPSRVALEEYRQNL